MSVISAKNGKLEIGGVEVADIRNISFSRTADLHEYASSSTSGRKRRNAGHKDCTGSFEMYAADGAFLLTFAEGDTVTIKGYSDASSHYFEEQVIISSIGHEVPVEDGGNVPITVEFGGDGEPTVV